MVKFLSSLLALLPLPFTELLIALVLILLYVISDGARLPAYGQLWTFFSVRWQAHNPDALSYLPPEIFDMILEHLDVEDVVRLRVTSHDLCRATKRTSYWSRRWKEKNVPPIVSRCRPLCIEHELIRSRKMDQQMEAGKLFISPARYLNHSLHLDQVKLCPGGRFMVFAPHHNAGEVLYYDLDEGTPTPRPLVRYECSRWRVNLFVSLCSSATTYEFFLVAFNYPYPVRATYEETQIDLWRVSLLENSPQLHATHISSLKINFVRSHHISLHGSILLQTCLGDLHDTQACVELIDLAQSTDDLIIGARFVPDWPSKPSSFIVSEVYSSQILPSGRVILSHPGFVAVYPPIHLAPIPPFALPLPPELLQEPLFAIPTFPNAVARYSPLLSPHESDHFLCYAGSRLHAIRDGRGPALPSASRSPELQGESTAYGHRSGVQLSVTSEGDWQINVVRCHLRHWSWCGIGLASEADLAKEDLLISNSATAILPFSPITSIWFYDEWSGRLVFSTPNLLESNGISIVDLPGPA